MTGSITKCEVDAVLYLMDNEVIKVAADTRCVSEHTEKNQVKSAMQKLEVGTQIGLVKKLFKMIYGIDFNVEEAKRILGSLCMLLIFTINIGNTDNFSRRFRRNTRRNEIECYNDI